MSAALFGADFSDKAPRFVWLEENNVDPAVNSSRNWHVVNPTDAEGNQLPVEPLPCGVSNLSVPFFSDWEVFSANMNTVRSLLGSNEADLAFGGLIDGN